MKNRRTWIFSILLAYCCALHAIESSQQIESHTYRVATSPWEEGLGNHRAVLAIDKAGEIVELSFLWRRSDKEVDKRQFLIVNATTGDTIQNIKRLEVSNENCHILFGPVEQKGTYYFYYLPYQVQLGHGNYSGDYLPREKDPDSHWSVKIKNGKKYPKARVKQVESRTAFDSFYPMGIIATGNEIKEYLSNYSHPFYVFSEDRKYPVRMCHTIPEKWLKQKPASLFKGYASPNEYYTFQLAVWAAKDPVNHLSYEASSLRCGEDEIPASAITCFNMEGVDPYGVPFKKDMDIPQGTVQPLWFGIDIPANQKKGIYKGLLSVIDRSGNKQSIPIEISIDGEMIPDRGDNEPWRHSRLRWLNSTLGIADTPTHPYTALDVNENIIKCLGREIMVDMSSGLPGQIRSWENDILAGPVRFVIQTPDGNKQLTARPSFTEKTTGHVSGNGYAEDDEIKVSYKAVMEFDGWIHYQYEIEAKKKLIIDDIRLEIPVRNEVATYFLGMGLPGQETPNEYAGKWDTPGKTVHQFGVSTPTSEENQWLWPFDSFWTGNAHAGIHCELRGSTYSGPLLNLYRPAYPDSWHNEGKGGFSVKKKDLYTHFTVYSGERTLEPEENLSFDFAMIITPVKKTDFSSQFTDRYYHNGARPVPTDEDVKAGVKIINIHHANEYNPFINYPFLTVDKIKDFISQWHEKGCKVKIYYTLRELSNAVTELWAIRSLGDEILRGGKGGGFPWCREHLVSGYTPQWYDHFDHVDDSGIVADAALLTSESDSRWYNYYVEGLAWMVKNLDIDGIYLDDVSFDRRILKRMRRAMESVKPDCIIDLHSNTGFSKGPANQYMEFFPYVDKVWFGESFLYDKMTPANWLVESSGIPFGMTGDMLHKGGNRWLGMQYGMTVRHPWLTEGVICDPRPIWKIWDEFGIQEAEIIGFWENDPVVSASDPAIKVTTYKKPDGQVLLSLGNYSDETKKVKLTLNKELVERSGATKLTAPEIDSFQPSATWGLNDEIEILPRQGWLLYLKK